MNDRFVKIETAAEMLDMSIWTIRKWVKQRKIKTYKFGRAVRIRESDLLRYAKVRPSKIDNNGS
jgi:excisionase family DNA binding protein